MSAVPTTCVVADDHPAVLDSITRYLAANGITIAGTATTTGEAKEQLERLHPTIAIVDATMPGDGGLELVRRLSPTLSETAMIIYTADPSGAVLSAALDAGARGVVLKEAPLADLLRGIEMAAAGRIYVDPGYGPVGRTHEEVALTRREREVLRALTEGLSYDEIGAKLFISPETVRTHVKKALNRLGAKTRVQAVAIALRRSLIA